MSLTVEQIKYISASVLRLLLSPFNLGAHIRAVSEAGATLYGVNHPGDRSATKFATFKQSISGNKVFVLPDSVNAPQNTDGAALSAANQLRVVATVDNVAKLRARGDQVAPTGGFVVGFGGGTANGEATIEADGAQVAGATSLNAESTGALTETVLVGDKINIAGDDTDYYVTETSQAFNGTTAVAIAITPPLQQAVADRAAITITAQTADESRVIIFDTAPVVGAVIDVWVMDAADIVTETGGAMTAGREYELECKSVYHSADNLSIAKL